MSSIKDVLSAFGMDAEGKERDYKIRYHLLCRINSLLGEFANSKDGSIKEEQFFATIALLSMARTQFKDGRLRNIMDDCYKAVQSLHDEVIGQDKDLNDEMTEAFLTIIRMTLGYLEGAKAYFGACVGITSASEEPSSVV